MWTKRIQTALLGTFFLLLGAPLILSVATALAPTDSRLSRLCKSELSGVAVTQTRPDLTKQGWLHNRYQEQFAAYFSQTFPLREPLIRASNELDFRLFKQSAARDNSLIVGKEGQLFLSEYLTEYCEIRPAMPVSRLDEIVRQMGELHAKLQKRGIPFVVVVTPSKAALYPQYIPDAFLQRKAGGRRSYEDLIPLLEKYGVPFVDGHEITRREKEKSPIPLFSRGGAHWTALGAFHTTRALVEALNRQRKTPLPALGYSQMVVDNLPIDEDADLAMLLNVVAPTTNYAVPHLAPIGSGASPPLKKLVVVGGSFDWKILSTLSTAKIYNSIDFYYYYHNFKHHFPDGARTPVDLDKLDWERDIFDSDAIVLEINEEALGNSGKNTHYDTFVSDALKHISKI